MLKFLTTFCIALAPISAFAVPTGGKLVCASADSALTASASLVDRSPVVRGRVLRLELRGGGDFNGQILVSRTDPEGANLRLTTDGALAEGSTAQHRGKTWFVNAVTLEGFLAPSQGVNAAVRLLDVRTGAVLTLRFSSCHADDGFAGLLL